MTNEQTPSQTKQETAYPTTIEKVDQKMMQNLLETPPVLDGKEVKRLADQFDALEVISPNPLFNVNEDEEEQNIEDDSLYHNQDFHNRC